MELKSIRAPGMMTLEEAEELKNKGAYLEMNAEGWICVYTVETDPDGAQ